MLNSNQISEIFIINLLKASNEVREFVAGYLDSWVPLEREMSSIWLPKQDQLQTIANRLLCSEDEVFEVLAAQFQETIRRQPLPPFSFEHLHKLASNLHQRRLAQIIGCDPRDVLNELFNINAILKILFEFDPVWVRQQYINNISKNQDASFVLLKLLAVKEQIETRYNIDDFGWEEFLDARHIISNSAFGKLQGNVIKQGFVAEASFRLLAAALDEDLTPRGIRHEHDDVFLDALGILEIKRRVDWIVRQLRESAQHVTNGNAITPNVVVNSDEIQIHLDFYELREPAVAWRKILKSEVNLSSIRNRLADFDVQTTGKSGTPKAEALLQVRVEEIQSPPSRILFWKKSRIIDNLLIVSCEVKEQPMPVDVLICSKVPSTKVSEITTLFTSLQGKEVATGYVLDLGEQILEKQLVFQEELQVGFKNACRQFLVEIIRGLILVGVPVPYDIDSIWKNRFNSSPPITTMSYKTKNNLSGNRNKILKEVQQQYSTNNNVKFVS